MPSMPRRGTGEGTEKKTHIFLLVTLIVAFIYMAAVASHGFGGWERAVLETFYGASERWRTVALIVTQAGSAWVWLGLVAFLFIVRRRPAPGLIMFRNGAVAYFAVILLKYIIARPRPELLVQDVVSREVLTLGLGFPSGHTAMATVMSLTLLLYLQGIWRWIVPCIWIGAVAWSRLYLGVHAPLDVVGGIVLGCGIILAVQYLPARGIWRTESQKKSVATGKP